MMASLCVLIYCAVWFWRHLALWFWGINACWDVLDTNGNSHANLLPETHMVTGINHAANLISECF